MLKLIFNWHRIEVISAKEHTVLAGRNALHFYRSLSYLPYLTHLNFPHL
ncbi:MAG: hypothetical protein HC852_21555 [Acaryochloridaceae cyanobacterium RU_4_10]|nr:hypothetical protein [Acaryochloridaceae cyanobacterium RU_4_10]